MNDVRAPKCVQDYEELLVQLMDYLVADPSDFKAAQFVLALLEENVENWRTIQALYREAIHRTYFSDEGESGE